MSDQDTITREAAVADEVSNRANPFDVATIEQLVALMSEHDLSEIDLRHGDARIRLFRGARVASPVLSPGPPSPPSVISALAPTVPEPARKVIQIKSPTPGTFYAQEKEGAAPYVKEGSRVTPTTVVGLIEAMKLYNEVHAECAGVIVRRLVENTQAVEYGTVLFEVDPTG